MNPVNKIIAACLIGLLTASCTTNDKNTAIMEKESTTSLFAKGEKLSSDWFTGDAFLAPLVSQDKNDEFSAGAVTFEIGARTNWHTHPKGQVLIVTEGAGFYQEKGKSAVIIERGDVVNIPENTEHWHGASATTSMTHIAITNFKDSVQVSWLDAVTDQEFNQANNLQ